MPLHSLRTPRPKPRRDIVMGRYLYLQPMVAKFSNTPKIGAKITALVLQNPADSAEVKQKSLVIYGKPGPYRFGFQIAYQDAPLNDIFPTVKRKSACALAPIRSPNSLM